VATTTTTLPGSRAPTLGAPGAAGGSTGKTIRLGNPRPAPSQPEEDPGDVPPSGEDEPTAAPPLGGFGEGEQADQPEQWTPPDQPEQGGADGPVDPGGGEAMDDYEEEWEDGADYEE
jgi:hypothetical protein